MIFPLPSFRIIAAVASLLASLPVSPTYAQCHLDLVSRLPLTRMDNRLLVPITLNGKTAELMLDTGAATSMLNLSTVDRIGLPHMHDQDVEAWVGYVSGVGGSRLAEAVTAKSVDLGGLKGRNYNFAAADVVSPPADGLLSIDLVAQFDIDLDLLENQVLLYYPKGDCRSPSAFLNSPLYSVPMLEMGSLRLPRVLVNIAGKDVKATIDTGADRSFMLRTTAEKLGLHLDALASDPHTVVHGVGPNAAKAIIHKFDSVEIGDLIFDHVPVEIIDEPGGQELEMALGADFLRTVHIWISYSSATLIMQFPPLPSKKIH